MVFLLMGRAGVGDGRVLLVGALERQNFELKCANNLSMSKSGNKKMKKLSISSSTEAAFSTKGKGEEAFESEKSAAIAIFRSVNKNPSLFDVWTYGVCVLIKANSPIHGGVNFLNVHTVAKSLRLGWLGRFSNCTN